MNRPKNQRPRSWLDVEDQGPEIPNNSMQKKEWERLVSEAMNDI